MSRRFRFILKTVFSLILIILLVARIDFSRLLSLIRGLDPVLYGLVFLFVIAGTAVSTFKWSLLLHSLGLTRPFPELLRLYYIGTFYNMFLPTTVGGDVVRSAMLGRENRDQVRTAASVFTERILGLHALLAISSVSYLLYPALFRQEPIRLILLSAAGLFVLLTVFILFPRLIGLLTVPFTRICGRIGWHRGASLSARVESAFSDIRRDRNRLLGAAGVSFLFQLTLPLQSILIARALHLDIPWQYFYAIKPVAMLLTTLPLSLNGIGVREWVVVFLYGALGVAREDILAVSFLGFIHVIGNALIGGLIHLRSGRIHRAG